MSLADVLSATYDKALKNGDLIFTPTEANRVNLGRLQIVIRFGVVWRRSLMLMP